MHNVALTYALALLLKLFDPVVIEVTVPFGPLALWTLSSFASTLSHAGIYYYNAAVLAIINY